MDKKNKKSLTEDSDPIDQPFTRLMASRRQCSSSSDSLISSTSTISVNSLQSIDSKIKFEELNQDEAKPKKRKKSSQPEVSTTSSILINDSSQGNSSNKSNTNIVAEGMAKKTTNLNKSSSFDNKIRSNDNQINISIKKLSIGNDNSIFKVPYGVHPWGTLCFYENKNLKFKRELYNIDEIKISNQTIFETSGNKSSPNYNINYTDWHFVLGNGFSLRKKTENEKSVIYFKNLDEKNKYRLFVNNQTVEINSSEEIEVYNANKYLKGIDSLKEISDAYEMAKSCYISIGIIGKFLNNFVKSFVNSLDNKLTKEQLASLPYWIMLKLNPEFMIIDNQVQKFLFNENKKAAIAIDKNIVKSIR